MGIVLLGARVHGGFPTGEKLFSDYEMAMVFT